MSTKITEEMYNLCKELYFYGFSLTDLEKEYNIDRHRLSERLKEDDVEIRKGHRTYNLNENYFDVIKTEEQAYILGYFYADGCNHSNNNQISIQLSIVDKEILQKFSQIFYGQEVLSYQTVTNDEGKQFEYCKLSLCSKHMSDRLTELGMHPRKSHDLDFPTWLDEKLYQHFIRGFIDGDGCIHISSEEAKRNASAVSIIATKSVNDYLLKYFKEELEVNCFLSKSSSQDFDVMNFIVLKGYANCKLFLDWLYKDATIYLQRKYNKYQEFLARYDVLDDQFKLEQDREDYKFYELCKDEYLNGTSLRKLDAEKLANRGSFTAWLRRNGIMIRGSDDRVIVTNEMRLEAKEKYLDGMTLREIEEEMGINADKFSIWLKNNGVEVYPRSNPTVEDYEKCKELYNEGYNLRQISEKMEIAQTTISRHLRAMGVEIGMGKRIDTSLFETCKYLYLDGWTFRELKEKKGIDPGTFSKWLKKEGVAINRTHRENSPRKIKAEANYEKGKELYLSGMSLLEIDRKEGIKRQNFTKWIKEQGVEIRSIKIDEEQKEEFKELYKAGKNLTEIEEITGVTRHTISFHLTNAGFDVSLNRDTTDYGLFEKCKSLYLGGQSIKQLHREHGISIAGFTNWLKEQGVEIKSKTTDEQKEQIRDYFSVGLNLNEIAEAVGVSPQNVANQLKAMGLREAAPKRKSSMTPELYEECKQLYLQGVSISELNREKKIDRGTFAKRLKADGVEIRK